MKGKYNVGDEVYWAKAATQPVRKECPVCFGKTRVTLILGNGELVETDCDYCGKGFESPKGYLTEYEWITGVERITISDKKIHESSTGEEIEYRFDNYVLKDNDIFSTEAEATARIQEKISEHIQEEEERFEHYKQYAYKSYSWHVGYHRREKKRAEKEVEYHGRKAISMQKHMRSPEALPSADASNSAAGTDATPTTKGGQ